VKVTFDSNVWESLVVEPSEYPAIRERILSGAISPYITEISVSLESIQKSARVSDDDACRRRLRVTVTLLLIV
jgi:hypothetical protein